MAIEVGRIDGSIYSDMTIRNLVLRDPKGIFAVSPEVHVVWSPFRYIDNHISVRMLESPLVVLARSPRFNITKRSEEQTSELQQLMSISCGGFTLEKHINQLSLLKTL